MLSEVLVGLAEIGIAEFKNSSSSATFKIVIAHLVIQKVIKSEHYKPRIRYCSK